MIKKKEQRWPGNPAYSFCNEVETDNHLLLFSFALLHVQFGGVWAGCLLLSFYISPMRLGTVRNKVTFDAHIVRTPLEIVYTVCSFLMYWTRLLKIGRPWECTRCNTEGDADCESACWPERGTRKRSSHCRCLMGENEPHIVTSIGPSPTSLILFYPGWFTENICELQLYRFLYICELLCLTGLIWYWSVLPL